VSRRRRCEQEEEVCAGLGGVSRIRKCEQEEE
jgi:hypothetical protein